MIAQAKKQVVIVSPALAAANNGNWQTARRWQLLLQAPSGNLQFAPFTARIVDHWPDGPLAARDDCMLALHARRSAAAIAAWARRHGEQGLAVVLTGTDLYRDIQTDAAAQRSLQAATRLVLLQEMGLQALPVELRARATVIFQSTPARRALPKPQRFLKALMVGHLRQEKSPETLFAAATLLSPQDAIRIDHIGAGLDSALAAQAHHTAQQCPHYRWLGEKTHEATRRAMQRAHLLVHTSRMEGGAHVVMEAVRCGTPVLASRIAGNVGMLGAGYAGYFDWGQADQLVTLLQRCRADADFYAQLQAQCAARAPLFATQTEQRALHQLVTALTTAPLSPCKLPQNP